MTARDVWRWTDERGVQRLVGTDELRAALSTSILPSATLVWREGMKEWAPADRVPELAAAVDAGNHPAPDDEDLRGTQRRATLVGLASGVGEPADDLDETVPPIRVPHAGNAGHPGHAGSSGATKPAFPKSGPITQIPPFGAPPQDPRNVVPPAPRVPVAPKLTEKPKDLPKPKPYRPITLSDVDGSWGSPSIPPAPPAVPVAPARTDDDEAPRRPRPSELAAAAAATATARATGTNLPAVVVPVPSAAPATSASAPTPAPGPVSLRMPAPPPVPQGGRPRPKSAPPPPPPRRIQTSTQVSAPAPPGPPPAPRSVPPKPPPVPSRPPPAQATPVPPPVASRSPKSPKSTPPPLPHKRAPKSVPPPLPPRAVREAAREPVIPPIPVIPSPASLEAALAPTPAAPVVSAPAKAFKTLQSARDPALQFPELAELPADDAGDTVTGIRETPSRPGATVTATPTTTPTPTPSPVVAAPVAPPPEPAPRAPGPPADTPTLELTEPLPNTGLAQLEESALNEETTQQAPPRAETPAPAEVTAPSAAPSPAPVIEATPVAEAAAPPERSVAAAPPERVETPAPLSPKRAKEERARQLETHRPLPGVSLPLPVLEVAKPISTAPSASASASAAASASASAPSTAAPSGASGASGAFKPPTPSTPPAAASGSSPSARPPAISERPVAARDDLPSLPPDLGDLKHTGTRRVLNEHVAVPLSSLVGAGGLLISMVITAFFVGRASFLAPKPAPAQPSLAAVPALAKAALPPPAKPCWMSKQPTMWAPSASRTIPFEAIATKGGALAFGYASDAQRAIGVEVDLASGEIKPKLDDKADADIEHVVPTPDPEFHVARVGGGQLKGSVEVAATPPFAVGQANGAVAIASPPDGAPTPLWPLEGDEVLTSANVHEAGDHRHLLVFRRGGAAFAGVIGKDGKTASELVKVTGSGGAIGKPTGAWNGREVAVLFADRPTPNDHYELRIAHGPPTAIPSAATVLPLPRGGPGGDAFSPDLVGLPDGRWLLMWTEGASGSRAVRAQTLTPELTPLGDPIALSPPAGNFGQGIIGVVGSYAATIFLSKGASQYELWGAVLQCGG